MEYTLLALLCVTLFYPTINYLLIVDDIRWAHTIQTGGLNIRGPWTFNKIYAFIHSRFYGGGTFTRLTTCTTCKGERVVPTSEDKRKTAACPGCQATGRMWYTNLKIEHGFTIALHTAICFMIYAVLGHNTTSFVAALLYAVNPVNMQTSVWLNGRRYAVNILLMLAMLGLGAWGLPFYAITPMLQVNVIFAPVLLGWWGVLVSLAMIALAWPRFIKPAVDGRLKSLSSKDMREFTPKRLIIIVKTFGFYIARMLLPGRAMMVHPFLTDWGLTEYGNKNAYRFDLWFVFGSACLAAVPFGLWFLTGPERWYFAFMVIATLQVSNVLPLVQTSADRYTNAANVFMMYFAAKVLGPVLAMPLFAYYATMTWQSLPLFKDIYGYYDYQLFYFPQDTIVRKFKINWLLKSQDVMGAWEHIKVGLIHNPKDFSMLYLAAICMAQMGDNKSFKHYIDRAEENHYIDQEPQWRKHLDEIKASYEDNKIPKRPGISPVEFARRRR